ncbi:MAG: flagellar basal body P-ring formation protein FlgA [Parvularculaceae bacterium]|nr:flagellar basal body P-ring formation protein FlgA [Parvularculaceae bacterium]
MKPIRLPGILAYATMAMWLLQLFISPVRAESIRLSNLTPVFEIALAEAGAPDEIEITLSAPDAVIEIDNAAAPEIVSTSYNPASGRFLMRLRDVNGTITAVSGVARSFALAPVLARDIARGEIIADADLEWSQAASPAGLYLGAAEDIVGKEARRPLRKGAGVRKNDIASPVLIRRGDIVTMLIEKPGLRLTQSGVAEQNGAVGDIVDIRNANSDRKIKAVVVAENLARVAAAGAGAY